MRTMMCAMVLGASMLGGCVADLDNGGWDELPPTISDDWVGGGMVFEVEVLNADVRGNFAAARNFETERFAAGYASFSQGYGSVSVDVDNPSRGQFGMNALNFGARSGELPVLVPGDIYLQDDPTSPLAVSMITCSGNAASTRTSNEDGGFQDLEVVVAEGPTDDTLTLEWSARRGTLEGTAVITDPTTLY